MLRQWGRVVGRSMGRHVVGGEWMIVRDGRLGKGMCTAAGDSSAKKKKEEVVEEVKTEEGKTEEGKMEEGKKGKGGEGEGLDAAECEKMLAELKKDVEVKQEALKQLMENKTRLLAEMENTRMIARRDVANAHQYGIQKFAKALLDVADNLKRALGAIPEEKLQDDSDKYLKELYVGVDMTRKGLMQAFTSFNIKEFSAEGEQFDPNKHQAMFEAVVPGKKEGTIISVTKTGYMLNERILRAAEVGVAKTSEESTDTVS